MFGGYAVFVSENRSGDVCSERTKLLGLSRERTTHGVVRSRRSGPRED